MIPTWDEYFLLIANVVSLRSKDPHTKCGAVIVDTNNRIVSTGYNGPPHGVDDDSLDWSRPNKYKFVRHAESNALAFAKCDLKGFGIFITHLPCLNCLLDIYRSGLSRIVVNATNPVPSMMVDYSYSKEWAEWVRILKLTIERVEL